MWLALRQDELTWSSIQWCSRILHSSRSSLGSNNYGSGSSILNLCRLRYRLHNRGTCHPFCACRVQYCRWKCGSGNTCCHSSDPDECDRGSADALDDNEITSSSSSLASAARVANFTVSRASANMSSYAMRTFHVKDSLHSWSNIGSV